jgi:Trypsin
MRRLLALLAVLATALAIGILPAGAITDGTPDQEGHPFVGLMVAKNSAGAPLWRCSGTLMSPTVFMVAGHCTEPPAWEIEIWFDSGFPTPIPLGAGFPAPGANPCSGITIRMVAHPRLMRIDRAPVEDFAILLSSNANTGGACFGDSGGPNFIGDSNVVGGVTSFGRTYTCSSHGGAYRVDQPDDLTWLATFGLRPPA